MGGTVKGTLVFEVEGIEVQVEAGPLSVFAAHRQTRLFHREAGGQLFGRAGRKRWKVTHATGPNRRDRRCRLRFEPDRGREQREIAAFHARGLDYLGDWHTHPEDTPSPSPRDLASIEDIVRRSAHEMPGFLLCIVGRDEPPDGLWLSLHRGSGQGLRAQAAVNRRAPSSTGSP